MREYPAVLTAALRRLRATVAPIPALPHSEVIERALDRLPPFDERGSGYRDTLVWLTVLKVASATNRIVAFVSADKAFADTRDRSALAPRLLKEAEAARQGNGSFLFFPSLPKFANWAFEAATETAKAL